MGEDDDDNDTVLLFLAFTGALYASVAVLPARSNLFSHLHIGCFFFTPPPNKPSADGSTYIFHLIFKTHQMRR